MVIVILVSCAVLIGISYLMLQIMSGIVVTPDTTVKEEQAAGELVLPLQAERVEAMQFSYGGRYLAYIAGDESGETELRVMEMDKGLESLWSSKIKGDTLAWSGRSARLIFEDGGDIFSLEAAGGTRDNLTQSQEIDYDPLPTPEGDRILWVSSSMPEGSEDQEFRVMDVNGSNSMYLAPYAPLATWSPGGDRLITKYPFTIAQEEEKADSEYLQVIEPGGEGWELFAEGEGEIRCIWWPREEKLYYMTTHLLKGKDELRGILVRVDVDDPSIQADVASTDGLGSENDSYSFYPSRSGERLAYLGSEGLEYLDMEEKVIHRFPGLGAELPLAWDEVEGFIYYAGPEGIYRVSFEETLE
ncbi:MAG: TolB family protein [Actinomycetota bacterium]